MAPKRPHTDADDAKSSKKPKTGFKVGPANLPDGTYRRKVQKIKKNLIHSATVKKSYAKLKAREGEPEPSHVRPDEEDADTEPVEPAGLELHPARQAMVDDRDSALPPQPRRITSKPPARYSYSAEGGEPTPATEKQERPWAEKTERVRRAKPIPFQREANEAQRNKEAAETRRKEIEKNNAERKAKLDERERWRRAMAKARTGGKNGQRKLGRESSVLLERVKRLVADG